jgi:hypothetical protein
MKTNRQTTAPTVHPSSAPISGETPGVKDIKKTGSALNDLLTSFNATCMGEGDINAGTNLLVARAITLSNLSRVGCGIEPPRLSRMKAGCSVLVSGGLSSSFVSELVAEVAVHQNCLTAHLTRFVEDKFADARKKGQRTMEFPSGPRANAAENALFQLEQKDSLTPVESQVEWSQVLNFPPNPRIEDLAARPKWLVTVRSAKDLEHQLNRLHGQRPLVSLSLNSPADANSYADTCNALLSGPYPVGEFGETVVANLLMSDPGNVLVRIAPSGGEKVDWLGRMLWLVDGTQGPDAAEHGTARGTFRVSDTGVRFGEALTAVLAKRLNNHDADTVVHPFDLDPAQIEWIAYLKEMEGRLPGISGSARSLLATLAFGLIELAKATHCKPLLSKVTPEGVEALGRWVIQRMANARLAMLGTAEIERKRQLAQRVLYKLGDGKLSQRDFCRAFTIHAPRIEEVLTVLEPAGLVRRVGSKWERTHQGPLPDTTLEELFN